MAEDILVFPKSVPRFIIFDKVNDLVVGNNLFVFVVDLDFKLDEGRILFLAVLVFTNTFKDLGTVSRPIFFRWEQEGTAFQFIRS